MFLTYGCAPDFWIGGALNSPACARLLSWRNLAFPSPELRIITELPNPIFSKSAATSAQICCVGAQELGAGQAAPAAERLLDGGVAGSSVHLWRISDRVSSVDVAQRPTCGAHRAGSSHECGTRFSFLYSHCALCCSALQDTCREGSSCLHLRKPVRREGTGRSFLCSAATCHMLELGR